MPFVSRCEQELRNLGLWWQRVALVGKINSLEVAATLLDEMESTKRRFEELQQQLVKSLAQEKLNKLDQELGARAQVAIDILIRNLFERTADVGFLATDDDIRSFLQRPDPGADEVDAIVERLREYTAKYSVYDEVIILDCNGRVRAHLDQDNPIHHSSDPLIAEALRGDAPYLEVFRPSDLQPKRDAAHLFVARICASDAPHSPSLGVLCLCFRFDDEMQGIFAQLAQGEELLAILADRGRVIASSQRSALPLGDRILSESRGSLHTTHYEGRTYLARTAATNGYQGYYGLPWQGHVMQPVESAFCEEGASAHNPSGHRQGVELKAGELHRISRTAARVTDDLTLAVLNGQIISAKRDAKEFMPVLNEIRGIGQQTREVFDRSIASLHGTVHDSLLSDARFQAFLAVDIMDRNLYERANDVRWWALTSRFREILADPARITDDRATLEAILAYINGLYTVYTNLFLFDPCGTVVAVSNPEEAALVGTRLDDGIPLQQVLELHHSQRYAVSPFQPTPLYGDRHTYIYLTSIRAPQSERVVGGIGVVFDSEPEFQAMLKDALPRNGEGQILDEAFGLFVESHGKIIASTRSDLPVGSQIAVDPTLYRLGNGEREARLIEFEGRNWVVGAAMSHGYREYKTSGDYRNDITALIFIPL